MEQKGLFSNYKYCEICRRPLALSYDSDICPICADYKLFSQVKEYIRENDVNEYQVAEHFDIPHSRVKQWIREGRIEYKDDRLNTHIIGYCQQCKVPISFGTLCTKCLKQKNISGHSGVQHVDPSRMRYLDKTDFTPF